MELLLLIYLNLMEFAATLYLAGFLQGILLWLLRIDWRAVSSGNACQ